MSYTIEEFTGPLADKIDKAFGFKNALYEFNPGKCMLPIFFKDDCQKILDAPVRKDDVWLISFPRTGSTWCQEMLWLIGNNFDYETARNTVQQLRAPLIEMSTVLYEYTECINKILSSNSVDYVARMPSPRFIKSHLPWQFCPTQLDKIKPKIIYTMRNPKDMCVSYYHHCQMFHNMNVDFPTFAELFMEGVTPFGSVWTHYLGFWSKRNDPNVLILKYEDMKKDLKETLRKIARFLEKPITERDVDQLSDFLSIQNMRENKGCNLQSFIEHLFGEDYYNKCGEHFFRKGMVGDWKNYMSPELAERFDKWAEENTKGTGLTFES